MTHRAMAQTLRQLRRINYLSQEAAAAKIGVQRPTYAYWELCNSCPKLENLEAISKAFGVSELEFFSMYLNAKREIKNAECDNYFGETDSESDSTG